MEVRKRGNLTPSSTKAPNLATLCSKWFPAHTKLEKQACFQMLYVAQLSITRETQVILSNRHLDLLESIVNHD